MDGSDGNASGADGAAAGEVKFAQKTSKLVRAGHSTDLEVARIQKKS